MSDVPSLARTCDLGRSVPYAAALELQRSLRAAREAGELCDTLLVLEHEGVITCGTRTEWSHIAYASTTGVPIVPVERGGQATWHGPGQVVLYPILDLESHGGDVRQLVRRLEQALIDTLAGWDIVADRADGYPGVWVGSAADPPGARKVASLGLRVTRGVTFHGIALNVDCDLTPFGWFTPCGIPDVTMTNMAAELGTDVDAAAVRDRLAAEVARQFGLDLEPQDPAALEAVARRFPQAPPDLALPTRPVALSGAATA